MVLDQCLRSSLILIHTNNDICVEPPNVTNREIVSPVRSLGRWRLSPHLRTCNSTLVSPVDHPIDRSGHSSSLQGTGAPSHEDVVAAPPSYHRSPLLSRVKLEEGGKAKKNTIVDA